MEQTDKAANVETAREMIIGGAGADALSNGEERVDEDLGVDGHLPSIVVSRAANVKTRNR